MSRRNNTSLSFADNRCSPKGICSAVLAGVAFAICVAAVIISYKKDGNAGNIVGSCGIMALLSAAMGIGFGIGGIAEGGGRIVSWIGTVFSALLLAGLVFLFISGF